MKQEYDSVFVNKVIDKLANIINDVNFENVYNVENSGFGGYERCEISNKTNKKNTFSIECSYGDFCIFVNGERLDIKNKPAPEYTKLNLIFEKLINISKKDKERKQKQMILLEQQKQQNKQNQILNYLENLEQR